MLSLLSVLNVVQCVLKKGFVVVFNGGLELLKLKGCECCGGGGGGDVLVCFIQIIVIVIVIITVGGRG